MKRKILLMLLIVLALVLPANAIWINQVYSDPLGSETYGEALELYNPTNKNIDISGWILWTTSSETDVIIPDNKYIEPYGYFLIADSGWNQSKDNSTWKNADLEDKMTLRNTNGGAALKDKEGNIVDAVGWGDEEEIPSELFEGVPAKKVKAGESLLRIQDTEDNSKDFIAAKPYFFTTGEIIINTDIGNQGNNSSDLEVLEDDDPNAEGIQIFPRKGGKRKIKIRTYSSGILMFRGKMYNLTFVNDSYETEIEISYSLEPGKYPLQTSQDTVDIEILPVKGLSINQRKLDLTIVPGSYETKKIKVSNTGNIELTVYAKSQEFSSGNKKLDEKIAVLGKILNKQWQEITKLMPGQDSEIEISVSIEENVEKGDYKTILSFKGE